MNKRFFALVAIIFVVTIAGYFLTREQSDSGASEIRLGSFSKAVDYAPYLVAKNKGWFEEAAKKYGATVRYTEFQSLPPINESFATDKVDIVFEAEAPAIVGKAAGIDIKIVGAVVFLTQEIIVHNNSQIKNVKDLRGKKIAVLAGTSAHQGLMGVLNKNGLTANDVEVIDMVPPDAKVAFETDSVDAWAIWPPFPQQAQLAGKAESLADSEIFIQSVAVARGKLVKENPKLVNELLDVIEKAQQWIVANQSEAQQIVAQELGLALDVVQLAWPKHDFTPTIGEKEIADIQAKADFLQSIGLIKNTVKSSELIYVR
ncbi:MAG: aliphatic sulfonate ABC transporter substrate-binding protein [Parcubacteria group bacterium]|nr:aliphatic sulfonate ABC transporter substrate-binding protein [Parcubacteria group bacterium]